MGASETISLPILVPSVKMIMMDASHAARLPQASKVSLLACCSRDTMEFTSLVRVFTADVDTCDLTHSRQLRVSAVIHGRIHRIRRCSCSRLPTPLPVVPCSSDSPRPVPCPESPVPGSCMHLSAPLDPPSPFSSGSRAGAVHSSHRLKTRGELDAAMHGRLTHLHVFMPKPPPRTEQRSMAACALPCGEARKLRRWATRSLLFIVTPEP